MSTVNLLPEEYVNRGSRRRANALCLGLFLVSMAAVGAAAFVSEKSHARTMQVRNSVEASYREATDKIAEMQRLEAKKQAMLAKADAISSLLEKVPRSHLLGMVTNSLPPHAAIVKFDMDTKKLAQRSSKAVGKDANSAKAEALKDARTPKVIAVGMDVVGLASSDADVSNFIKILVRNKLVADASLLYTQERVVDGASFREFQVRIDLKQAADAIEDPLSEMPSAQMEEDGDAAAASTIRTGVHS